MKNTIIQIQIFYEIASAIGKSPHLEKMIRESLSTYMRKLCCSTGIVLQSMKNEDGSISYKPMVTIPYKVQSSATMGMLLRHIPSRLRGHDLDYFRQSLPLIIPEEKGKQCYIMDVPDFGLLVLFKSGEPLGEAVIKSLGRLNNKLADACLVCLHHEETTRINTQLKKEIEERQRAEETLRLVLDELESRVAIRTRELVQTNRNLEEALAKVKLLNGLLPICAVCKKIRDDQGYWNQLEAYISDHSEVMFSHGLCPECARKLFGDIVDAED